MTYVVQNLKTGRSSVIFHESFLSQRSKFENKERYDVFAFPDTDVGKKEYLKKIEEIKRRPRLVRESTISQNPTPSVTTETSITAQV